MGVSTGEEVKGVLAALFLHGLQWLLAYLALDLTFRTVDVSPGGLDRSRDRCRRRYALAAAVSTVAIGTAQMWIAQGSNGPGAGPAVLAGSAATAGLGWLPWWLLWRFGWRKQFPHLYQAPRNRRRG